MVKMHIRLSMDWIKEGEQIMLIKIEAIVREEKLEDVKEALNAIQVNGITAVSYTHLDVYKRQE